MLQYSENEHAFKPFLHACFKKMCHNHIISKTENKEKAEDELFCFSLSAKYRNMVGLKFKNSLI